MNIKLEQTGIPDLVLLNHDVFEDRRGAFVEYFRRDVFTKAGLPGELQQINYSRSMAGVVRGLHFQWDAPMAKCMRVIHGRAFLVAVDIRKGSPTLGKWFGVEIEAGQHRQLLAPPGFARGFAALEDNTEIEYLCTAVYNPRGESGIRWNDPEIGIEWPVANPEVSDKDGVAQSLSEWLARPESDQFGYE